MLVWCMCSRMQALFQPEPGTEQVLMRKKKINIHLVKKCIGSCIFKWGQGEDRTRNAMKLGNSSFMQQQ